MSARDNGASYTLTTPAGSLTIEKDATQIRSLVDIEWNSTVRSDITNRAQSHGALFGRGYKAHGVVTVTERIRSLGNMTNVEAERFTLTKNLNSLMSGDGLLEWTPQGASTEIALDDLYLVEGPSFAVESGTYLVQYQLGSPKPFAEDAAAVTTDSDALTEGGGGFTIPLEIPFTITPSSGGSVTVTHSGDFPEAYPLLRVVGPITDPIVVNQTTGKRILFTGSIAGGDYWEIDLYNRSVKLNGITRVRAINVAESEWWSLEQGANTLQLAGSGYTSSTLLRVLMKSAWA